MHNVHQHVIIINNGLNIQYWNLEGNMCYFQILLLGIII